MLFEINSRKINQTKAKQNKHCTFSSSSGTDGVYFSSSTLMHVHKERERKNKKTIVGGRLVDICHRHHHDRATTVVAVVFIIGQWVLV